MTATCPDTGTLRALLDDEAPPETAAHVAGCTPCGDRLADLRAGADAVGRALALLAPAGDGGATDARRDDLAARRRRRPAARHGALLRRVTAAAAALVVVVATLGTAAGREAAASFLAQFRGERIQVVAIDPHGAMSDPLRSLASLGTMSFEGGADELTPAASVEEAEQRSGLAVRAPSPGALPEGFRPEPADITVHGAGRLRVSFDEASVRAHLDAHGSDLAIPPGLTDTTLTVDLPPAVALVYRGPMSEELVVGQAGQVTAGTEGPLDLAGLREFLLDLPGLDEETVAQLRAIDDWRTTLPLPVPAGMLEWEGTTVAGAEAVRLRGTSGFGSAILWLDGGVVRGVGGLVPEDVTRRVAEDIAR